MYQPGVELHAPTSFRDLFLQHVSVQLNATRSVLSLLRLNWRLHWVNSKFKFIKSQSIIVFLKENFTTRRHNHLPAKKKTYSFRPDRKLDNYPDEFDDDKTFLTFHKTQIILFLLYQQNWWYLILKTLWNSIETVLIWRGPIVTGFLVLSLGAFFGE